ncbi:hypothetical protein BGX38DRAFT_1266208 [Terfezia claveryi]|nr:hypothetical protein BGX38DRAFT_1266208 [Terfezia claveryi]
MASSSKSSVVQASSKLARQPIKTYAEENPKTTWRHIKRWFESANPNKELTQSQISTTLNPKRPCGPSDVDPVQGPLTSRTAAEQAWKNAMHDMTLSNGGFSIGLNAFLTISMRSSDLRVEMNILKDILL